jgi:hypothetical protein
MLSPAPVAALSDLPDRIPRYPLVGGVDLLVVRFDDDFSIMHGPCLHRGALMTDGHGAAEEPNNTYTQPLAREGFSKLGHHGAVSATGVPLTDIPMFVSDMSDGALSEEAKIALSHGAELAGTGICSGEGGMLPEEQEGNSRYLYELASGRFGWSLDKVKRCEASHFLSRACGHSHLRQFDAADPVLWKRDMADLAGVRCVGVGA